MAIPESLQTRLSNVVAAAAAPTRTRQKATLEEFALTPEQRLIEETLPWCGWAKRYIRIAAILGSRCTWQIAYKDEPIEDPYLNQLVASIKSPRLSQKKMRERAITLQRQTGNLGVITKDTPNGVQWEIAHPGNLIKSQNPAETFLHVTRPGARPGKLGCEEIPLPQLRRFWIPDEQWPHLGRPKLADISYELDAYKTALEAITAKMEQNGIMSKLLHIKPAAAENSYHHDLHEEENPKVDEAVEEYARTARNAAEKGGLLRALPHPFLHPGDLSILDLGEVISRDQVEGLKSIVESASIGLDVPSIWLVSGEGAGNHWSSPEMRRAMTKDVVHPEVETSDEMFSEYVLRPLLHSRLDMSLMPEKWRYTNIDHFSLCSNFKVIEEKPDNAALMLDLYKSGVAERQEVARAANATLLDIGEQTELEHLYNIIGKPDTTSQDDTVEEPVQSVAASALALL